MAHASGNPTWQDYPNTSTLVTAGSLEAIEKVVDGLAAPPSCEARLTADYVNLGTDFYVMRGQMAVPTGMDPYGMFQQPGGVGTNYQIVVPSGWGGRYEFVWEPVFSNMGPNPGLALLLLNCPDTANSTAAVANYQLRRAPGPSMGSSASPQCRASVVLSVGDKVALAVNTGLATWTLAAVQNVFTRTKVTARYIGPT